MLRGVNVACIAPVGQALMHLPHVLHTSGSIYARLSAIVIAPNGHVFAHFPHPIQAFAHTFRATAPLSRLEHATHTLRSRGPAGRSSIRLRGHSATQLPQAVHFSVSTFGSPSAVSILNAPNLHTATQSPHPRQPNEQPRVPTATESIIRHERMPSYSKTTGLAAQVPLHFSTAMLRVVSTASTPSIAAILAIPSAPETGQKMPSRLPFATHAPAKSRQPL